RYVRQLQRLQLLFSPTAADARGARYRWGQGPPQLPCGMGEQQLPIEGPRPDPPHSAAVNGTVREELIASMTSEEILQLATKLAGQSGLDLIRIRKPLHNDNPSVQGQWHPLTNKPSALTVRGPRLQPQ
ncbi:RM43 protein, partial [Grus americana]|nr:RM43 protein [Grus americana]